MRRLCNMKTRWTGCFSSLPFSYNFLVKLLSYVSITELIIYNVSCSPFSSSTKPVNSSWMVLKSFSVVKEPVKKQSFSSCLFSQKYKISICRLLAVITVKNRLLCLGFKFFYTKTIFLVIIGKKYFWSFFKDRLCALF